jgi:hypothetical protein
MRFSKKFIEEEIAKLELSTEDNYLRMVLKSYFEYNHRARLDLAEILYKSFLELPENASTLNLRGNIFAEIYVKFMEVIEDVTLLALMFTSKNPLNIFMDNKTPDYYSFLGKARRGLPESQLLKIYGFKPIRWLLRHKYIEPAEEADFKKIYKEMFNSKTGEEFKRWRGFGKFYTQPWFNPSRSRKEFTKTGAVSAYHNIKHAYKILTPNDIYRKFWNFDDSDPSLSIVERYAEFKKLRPRLSKNFIPYANRKLLVIGTFPINKESIKDIFERIHPSAQTARQIADIQLHSMDDPKYSTKELRFLIHRMKHVSDPKSYELCPCGSRRKFKKCHQNKYKDIDSLIFDQSKYD